MMNLIKIENQESKQKERDLPFYFANYDPFNMLKHWNDLLENKNFKEDFERILNLNLRTIKSGFFKDLPKEQRELHANDICLQSCLISYQEVLRAQGDVAKLCGYIDAKDLTDMNELFENYGTLKKRKYQNSMIFTLNWFTNLLQEYKRQGFHAEDKFYDFNDIGYDYQTIKEYIKSQEGKLYLDLRIKSDKLTGELNLDFNNKKTKLKASKYFFQIKSATGYETKTLSQILEDDNPFQKKEFINFILPLDYRGFVLPLINVTEIEVKEDGITKIFSHKKYILNQKKMQIPYLKPSKTSLST